MQTATMHRFGHNNHHAAQQSATSAARRWLAQLGMQPCIVLAMLVLLSSGGASVGQQFDDRNNAAFWYDRAIQALERAEANMTQNDWTAYEQYVAGQMQVPPPNVQSYLNVLPTVFDNIQQASQREMSNYHLDYSEGFHLLLPHLPQLRNAGRAMANDAEIRLRNGDSAGAAKNLAALYAMSVHFGDDQTLISSLVGNAMYNLADGVVQQGFDLGMFNEADAATLLRMHNRLNESDPIGMTDAVLMESEMVSVWLERMWESEDGLQQFADLMGMDPNDLEMQMIAQQFDGEKFTESLSQYENLMGQVVEAFEMEDRDAGTLMMETLQEELINGEHGMLAQLLMPSMTRLIEILSDLEGKVADRRAMLEKILTGEENLTELMNAATLYLQAIEQYNKLDQAQRDAMEIAGERYDAADRELLHTALDEADTIIDTIRAATQLRRCDFEVLYRVIPRPLQLCPDYVHGLHALWRMLYLDSVRALRQRDGDKASDRAALMIRMSSQMDHAGPLLRPMIAHHWFNHALSVAREGIRLDYIDDDQRQRIGEATRTISRRDPFGYAAAIEFSEKRVSNFMTELHVQAEMRTPHWMRSRAPWNPKQMLYFIAVHDLLHYDADDAEEAERGAQAVAEHVGHAAQDDADAARPAQHAAAVGPFRHLSDLIDSVLDSAALRHVVADMEHIGPQLALGEFEAFALRDDMPALAPFDQWRFQTRADLRDASRLLLLPDPDATEANTTDEDSTDGDGDDDDRNSR